MKIKIVYLLGLLLIMNVHLKAKASDSELFFYNSIEKIKEIQDLDESIIKRLKEVYDRNLFIGNTKSEIIALNWAMSKEKIDQNIIIKIFNEEILHRALIIFQDDISYFSNKLSIPKDSLDGAREILYKRSLEIAYNEFVNLAYPTSRYKINSMIRDKYKNELNEYTLKFNISYLPYNLRLVINNAEKLNLRQQQKDSIISSGAKIKTLEAKGVITKNKNNRWEYERKAILNILNEDQVGLFVAIRNHEYSLNQAIKIWDNVKKYDLNYKYDSIEVVNSVYNYNIQRERIKYIHKDNIEKQQELEDFLYNNNYPIVIDHIKKQRKIKKVSNTNLKL